MINQKIKAEAIALFRSFVGAVAAAAALAALHWIGANIPAAINALGMLGGAHIAQHVSLHG